jgi:hypothetical protein
MFAGMLIEPGIAAIVAFISRWIEPARLGFHAM